MIRVEVTKHDFSKEVLADIHRNALSYVTHGGQMIQSEMKSRADGSVRTGNLRGSIQSEAFVEDGVPTSETGPTAEYAPYVEYGTGVFAADGSGRQTPWSYKDESGKWHTTSGQKAQPFAEPGFQAAKQRLPELAARLLK